MNQLKGTLYYYSANMRYSLLIFWSILLGIMLLSLIADLVIGGEGDNIYFSFALPLYLFAAIIGFWVVKNVIPFLVKMGVTRMNIYIGTGIVFILLALFNGVISNTLHTIITEVFDSNINSSFEITVDGRDLTGSAPLIELFAEDTWWNHFVIDVSFQFFCVAVSFLFGLVFYRYKLTGGAVMLGVLLFIFVYSITSGWLVDTILNILNDFSMIFFYQLFLAGLVIYLLTHLLLRRLTI